MEGTKAQRQRGTKRMALRRGFSFAEVMFAVIILGIGFIMIAAIFPVAISQTQASLSDSAGVTVGRTGSIYIENLISQGTGTLSMGDVTSYASFPPGGDGLVHPIGTGTLTPDRWDRLKGNFIDTSDPRFAWIPIGYKMQWEDPASTSPTPTSVPRYAEFYVLAVQAQTNPIFSRVDYDPPATPGSPPYDAANLKPKLVPHAHIQDNNPTYGVDTVTFSPTTPAEAEVVKAAAPGAYILIAFDNLPAPNARLMNGQYYRLGSNLAPNIWELQPGNDFQISPGADGRLGTADDISDIPDCNVLMVGRGYDDSSAPTQYSGAAMDLFMLPPIVVQLPVPPPPP